MTEKQMKKVENLKAMISSIDKKIEKLQLQRNLYVMSLENLEDPQETNQE